MIEQQRDKKMRDYENDQADMLQINQTRSVGPVGNLSRRSNAGNSGNVGLITPTLGVNSRTFTMPESDDMAPSSQEYHKANTTSNSAKDYVKKGPMVSSVR